MGKKYSSDLNGVLNIYKEKDYTSHDVVAIVRKLTKAKAGHTGTLDPNAEGVLPICLGKCTKLSDYIMADEKEYRAEIILGKTTDTQDNTGEVLETFTVDCNEEDVIEVLNSFVGEYYQMPPMYSAIKIDGQKLYDLARAGKTVERKKRLIEIKAIKIVEMDLPRVLVDVTCSKGTYIRTLCHDIGEKLACGGHMGSLLRLRTGAFGLNNAIKLEELKKIVEEEKIKDFLLTPEQILLGYKKVCINEIANKFLYNGNKLDLSFAINLEENKNIVENDDVLVYDYLSTLIGIYKVISVENNLTLKPVTML